MCEGHPSRIEGTRRGENGTGTGHGYQNFLNFRYGYGYFYVGSDIGTTRILNFRIGVGYEIAVTRQLPGYSRSDTDKIRSATRLEEREH